MRITRSLPLLLVVGACAAPEPPAKPSWHDDVLPIIQGSCANCHGATAATTGGTPVEGVGIALPYRFDICDPQPFMDIGVKGPPTFGAKNPAVVALIKTVIAEDASPGQRMPPPPAEPLSDYERTVLLNWLGGDNAVPSCGTRRGNRRPRVTTVSAEAEGGDLVAVLEVTDPDGDPVLGVATPAGGEAVQIPGPGRHRLRFPGAARGMVEVVVTDGQTPAMATVKAE